MTSTGCAHTHCHICRPTPSEDTSGPRIRGGRGARAPVRIARRFTPVPLSRSPWAHELTAGTASNHTQTSPGGRMSTEQTRGWFWPTQARKAHFDRGDGKALCGKWARVNPLGGGAAPFQGDVDSPPSKDDCVACRRKLDAETRQKRGSDVDA
jgi:hypothetical protein